MLSVTRFPLQPSRYNACWQCLSRINQRKSTIKLKSGTSVRRTKDFRRLFSAEIDRSALREETTSESTHVPFVFNSLPKTSSFRQGLQKWETENASSQAHCTDEQSQSPFSALHGFRDTDILAPDEDVAEKGAGEFLAFQDDELVELGYHRTFLSPGDLVELRSSGTPTPELAVFVRKLDTQIQFYAMSGRYVHRERTASIRFFVPNFIPSEELDPILPYLPSTDVTTSLEDRLQNLQSDVPRDVGTPLVRKLTAFVQQSEVAYQSLASRLDNAHNLLANKRSNRNATLDEITNQLVSPILGPKQGDEFPAPVLFAVHRAISANDTGFRVANRIRQRADVNYEIISINEMRDINWVVQQVRDYREDILNGTAKSQLHKFIRKARWLIDQSRQSRATTSSGRLGLANRTPSEDHTPPSRHPDAGFSRSTESFLRFLESWVCLDSIRKSSPVTGVGYTILRAINRYDESHLSQTTGWTLLQELGYISPWETKSSFDLRLPEMGRNAQTSLPSNSAECFIEDKLKDVRRDWLDLPVFCVDDVNAQEIDDGFSIEAAAILGEYWVHTHIADPAAHIDPQSPLATFASSLGGTVYLPERTVSMLPHDYVVDKLSLDSGRPCITFSARMNLEGDILESKVAAGIVRNVTFLTPSTLDEVTVELGTTATAGAESIIGGDMPAPIATRHLTESSQLPESHKVGLKLIRQITTAREKQLFAKGRVISQEFRPSVNVSLQNVETEKQKGSLCVRYRGDPTIKVSIPKIRDAERRIIKDHGNTVMNVMLLANEIAAQWCSARGIPIPYRVTPNNPSISDIADYFQNTLLPAVDETGAIHREIFAEYYSRAGLAVLSSTPGPHIPLGVKMTAKCTSPLRRYPDLLLHWQVGAALLRESETGKSLIGNTKDDFLPFSKSNLDVILTHASNRELILTYGVSESHREWSIHFLLRVWENQDPSTPLPLKFMVRTVNVDGMVGGVIEDYFIGAQLDRKLPLPDWLSWDDLEKGDRFEAEITHIDVYSRSVVVKFLRPLDPH